MKKLLIALTLSVIAVVNATAQTIAVPVGPQGFYARYFGPSGGSQTNYFWLQAIFPYGRTALTGPITLTNQPASYTSTQFVQLTWQPVVGASGYDVMYTTSSTAPSAACNCAIDVNETSTGFEWNNSTLLNYTVKYNNSIVPTLTGSSTPVLDLAVNTYFEFLLTGNVASSTLVYGGSATALPPGLKFVTRICQDATGSRTFAFPSTILNPTAITSTASYCTAQNFIVVAGGAKAVSLGVAVASTTE